jgi:hypothetical protein
MSLAGCLALVVVIFYCFPAGAQQQASREDVVQFMDVLKCRETTKQIANDAVSQMLPYARAKLKERLPNVSDEALADFDGIVTGYVNKALPFDELFDAMIPVYQKSFTAGEVKAMIDFYSSGVGQGILAKMPIVSSAAAEAIKPIVLKAMSGSDAYMHDSVQQFLRKHPELLPPPPATDQTGK